MKRVKNFSSLRVQEVIYLDNHNKITLVSRKNKKYLFLLGKNNNILVDAYEDDSSSS